MKPIYSVKNLKKWDDFTIKNEPISSLNLMERAAIACCKRIIGSYRFNTVTIICGMGNNGGDGLAIARILYEFGIKPSVFICQHKESGSVDFESNLKRLPKKIKPVYLNDKSILKIEGELIIDALFGSGLNQPITNWIGSIVKAINVAERPIVAIDMPSGLYADDNSKNSLANCVKASHTLSFEVPKMSFFYAEYAEYVGKVSILDINLSSAFKAETLAYYVVSCGSSLKKQSNFIHKGDKGYLSVIAGSESMLGSALLCARAAFKTGCGYVGVLSPNSIVVPLANQTPEAIWMGEDWNSLSNKTSAIAIGPGIGITDHAKTLLQNALLSKMPLIIDADAINLISANPELLKILPKGSILTPHLGELTRLIGEFKSPEERLKHQLDFCIKHQIYIIQKGAYSKLTCPDGKIYINSTGNEGMASAGMGDALTGMIGSFLAQGYSPFESALNGMFYHGLAGDIYTRENGQLGMMTSDLIKSIPKALNQL